MVRGAVNTNNFKVMDYNETEIEKVLKDYFSDLK